MSSRDIREKRGEMREERGERREEKGQRTEDRGQRTEERFRLWGERTDSEDRGKRRLGHTRIHRSIEARGPHFVVFRQHV